MMPPARRHGPIAGMCRWMGYIGGPLNIGLVLFREGSNTLVHQSLAASQGETDAFDLFFLAMARQKLGQPAQARADFDRAAKWLHEHPQQSPQWADELRFFRAEADAVLAGPSAELPADVFDPATNR